MRIAISCDENPGDPGAVAADGTQERTLNISVCNTVRDALLRCGVDAWFDDTITFVDRVARANSDGTEVLVACAHNESTAGRSGTQFVFCPGGQSFGAQSKAASLVYAQLAKLPGWPSRIGDAVEDVYECCAFNRDTVYCELLFMSVNDEPLWSKPFYHADAAEAIVRGLADTYGFTYVQPSNVQPQQPPAIPALPSNHWSFPYTVGADMVVVLPTICHAPVWEPGVGHWFRNTTIIGVPQSGEYAEWVLANRVGGVWYVMDESGGPQGQGPNGRLPVDQAYWIDDSVTDSTGCGGTSPPAVAAARGGQVFTR